MPRLPTASHMPRLPDYIYLSAPVPQADSVQDQWSSCQLRFTHSWPQASTPWFTDFEPLSDPLSPHRGPAHVSHDGPDLDSSLIAAPFPHVQAGLTITDCPDAQFSFFQSPALFSNFLHPIFFLPFESITRYVYTLTTDSKLWNQVQYRQLRTYPNVCFLGKISYDNRQQQVCLCPSFKFLKAPFSSPSLQARWG